MTYGIAEIDIRNRQNIIIYTKIGIRAHIIEIPIVVGCEADFILSEIIDSQLDLLEDVVDGTETVDGTVEPFFLIISLQG